MTPFRFRLARLQHWQQQLCRTEEGKLKQCLAAMAETQRKLEHLAARCASTEQDLSTQPRITPSDLRALADFRRRAQHDRLNLQREQISRQAALATQQENLLRERRKLEALDKLHARALAQHRMAEDRELDAMGLESFLAARWRAAE
jgi:flagellar export protein FliJ